MPSLTTGLFLTQATIYSHPYMMELLKTYLPVLDPEIHLHRQVSFAVVNSSGKLWLDDVAIEEIEE